MKSIFLLLLLVGVGWAGCSGKPNQKPLVMEAPLSIKNVTNGQKMVIGDLNDPDRNFIYVANLKGTPYEMGLAFGQLFEAEIKDQMSNFYDYYESIMVDFLEKHKTPAFIAKGFGNSVISLLKHILDINCRITRRYTHPRYFEELKGIGDGAKFNSRELARLNIFPELIKAACTVAGAWGKATENGETLHLRSLDWDASIPISKYPLITVYHPSVEGYHTHANLGWVGLIGCLSGISTEVSVGEKVMYTHQPTRTTRYGNPWTYVLRDVLYEATGIESALKILQDTHRTCTIHLGLASSREHTFRMLEYAQHTLNVYDDTNYTHYTAAHPKKEGIAYFDKRVQPSGDDCVGNIMAKSNMYGHWELESLWREVGNTHETGDTQMVVFNLETQQALVSYSKYQSGEKAYARSPIHVNFHSLFQDF